MTVGQQNPLNTVQSKAAEIKEALCFLRHGGFENSLRNISVLPQDIPTAFSYLAGSKSWQCRLPKPVMAPILAEI
jgi:hypothetical protein